MPDWVLPWVLVALSIWPLVQATRWIHRHLQGMGLLLTNDSQGAVMFYYLMMLPGVFLREGTQWLVAQALRVRIKKFQMWPEKQKGGSIRLGLVDIAEDTDIIRATFVSLVPTLLGIVIIAWVGGSHFKVDDLLQALSSGDIPTMTKGFGAFMSAGDFFVWLYVVFAIANAMLPEEHDRINWWLIGGVFAVVAAFLWVLDLGILLQAGLDGPLAAFARMASAALVMSLVLDWIVMGIISLTELVFARFFNREIQYH
jgi:hypothetical protein